MRQLKTRVQELSDSPVSHLCVLVSTVCPRNKLMDEFAGDPVRLIADVDCTSAGKPLCEQFGVKGYPSIK